MSRHTSLSSLKDKLQLDSINPLYVIGAGLVLCIVLVLTGQALWQTFSGSHITIDQAQNTSSEQHAQDEEKDADGDGVSASSEQTPTRLFVHVSGAVQNPGLYELEFGSRVFDAIQAAGGLSAHAAEESVNLAQVVEDGSHITVLTKEQQQGGANTSKASDASGASPSNTAALVNINTASVKELTTLKGVGEATAEKIIADREQKGPFKSKEDLKRVTGIGEKKYESLKDYITV